MMISRSEREQAIECLAAFLMLLKPGAALDEVMGQRDFRALSEIVQEDTCPNE